MQDLQRGQLLIDTCKFTQLQVYLLLFKPGELDSLKRGGEHDQPQEQQCESLPAGHAIPLTKNTKLSWEAC